MFSRDIVLSLQRLPPGYRLVGAESVITVIGTAPRPAQEDELLPLATPGAPADRPRLRITTSSALRASLMIKDRVLTAPSGVRGGSFSRQTCRLAILAPRLDHPIKGPALGAFIAQNGRGGDNADRRRSVRSVSGAMMLEGPPSTIHQSADSQPNTVVRSAARRRNWSPRAPAPAGLKPS